VKEYEYGKKYFVFMHENRTIKLDEIVLRREWGA
jgi:hypothetical protein